VPEVPPLEPRYNIAPTQGVLVVRVLESGEPRAADFLRWGLVPSWADDPKTGYRMINARAETAPKSPAFRTAIRKRRCVLAVGAPFGIAGHWAWWVKGEGLFRLSGLTVDDRNGVGYDRRCRC
jgi:hypothetical protein